MAQRSARLPRNRVGASESQMRRRDVKRKTYGYSGWFVAWSYVHVAYALFMSTIYFDQLFGRSGWLTTPVAVLSCFAQVGLGNYLFKLPTRVPWTVFGLFCFYAFTLVSGVLANADFGRNVVNSLGWTTLCLLFYGSIALSVIQATYLSATFREVVKWGILITLVISGLVGLAQNLDVGAARTVFAGLGKQPEGIYRPTGLTNYPSQLGFQGTLGMAILGCPLYTRNLKWWEWIGIAFFAMVVLNAQYRSMYYAGIGLCVVAFGVLIWRRDRAASIVYSAVAVCVVAIPLIAFPNRFVYGLRSSENDPALEARQNAWQEAETAMAFRPLTGIGPDANLVLGNGVSEAPDKFSTSVIDNIYLTVRTCYGWVGVVLATTVVMISTGGLALRVMLGAEKAKNWAVASLILTSSVLVFSLTGNSLVHATVGCLIALVFPLCSANWKEEAESALLSDEFVRIRKVASNGLRRLGIDIG